MQAGEPKKAIDCCLSLGHWDGAAAIAEAAGLINMTRAQIRKGQQALAERGYVMPLGQLS